MAKNEDDQIWVSTSSTGYTLSIYVVRDRAAGKPGCRSIRRFERPCNGAKWDGF